jgi:3-deoxy-D-manno-octulosonic-acid transferase
MLRLLYSLAWTLALPLACARLWWRGRKEPGYRRYLRERFGFYPAPGSVDAADAALRAGSPLIWLHAVSVGETRAAEPLVHALLQQYPASTILLTHMTASGRDTGRSLFAVHGSRVLQSWLPYDLVWMVRRFLRHFSPRLCILMETEVWPNLLRACEQAHVPVALVNARLSERSLRRGQKMGGLMRDAARRISVVAAQTAQDGARIASLGAVRVEVTGSIKFDLALPEPMLALGHSLRGYIGAAESAGASAAASAAAPTPRRQVLLCASTREGEEALLLPELAPWLQQAPPVGQAPPLLLLVPRHPQRFDDVAQLVRQHGLHLARRSTLSNADLQTGTLAPEVQVVLGDSMGEMLAYYFACDLAFIGGSLLPLGGQNLIEACALGKPVLIGPHTFNFLDVTELALAAGAARRVSDAAQLRRDATQLLEDRTACDHMGECARGFAMQHRGATTKTLNLLQTYLD